MDNDWSFHPGIGLGRLKFGMTPDEIYHQPQTMFVAGFIGALPMNLIAVQGNGTALRLPKGEEVARHVHHGEIIVGIRPEKIVVSDKGLKAKVLYREDLGSHRILLGEIESGAKIRVSVLHGGVEANTSEVHLSFKPEDMHLFDPQTQARMN